MSIFDDTATGAVDHILHRKHSAPRGLATIMHANARPYIAEDYGITLERADEMRDVMIEAASAARVGAADKAWSEVSGILHALRRLNQKIDSLSLERLIEQSQASLDAARNEELASARTSGR